MAVINTADYRAAGRGYNVKGNESSTESSKDTAGRSDIAAAATELKRMYWHSRRGMLELDLLLVPFATECLVKLDAAQINDYRALLEQEDQDLWTWLTRREVAPTETLQRSIDLILQHNTAVGERGAAGTR
jgi:antitoxin CptB